MLKVKVAAVAGGAAESMEADVVLVAIGRVPYTEGLGLEAAGVKNDNRGRIVVDPHFRTNAAGLSAIGDVIAGPMLAYKAEDVGVAVAEVLARQSGHVNYDVVSNVVYTRLEIASVGKSEEKLKQPASLTMSASSRLPSTGAPAPIWLSMASLKSSPITRPTVCWACTS